MITEDSIYGAIIEASADKVFCQKYALLTIVGNDEMSYKYYVDELEKDRFQSFPEFVFVDKFSREWMNTTMKFVIRILDVINPPLVLFDGILERLQSNMKG